MAVGSWLQDILRQLDPAAKEVRAAAGGLAGEIAAAGDELAGALAPVAEDARRLGSGVANLFSPVADAAAGAASIDALSASLGISTTRLQELEFATAATNVPFGTLTDLMASLGTTLAQGDEDSAALGEALASLGVSTTDAAGELLGAGEVFDNTLLALAGIGDDAERSQLAMHLFGSGATEMLPLLDEGAAGIDALAARAHELGVVMDEQSIATGVNFNNAMVELSSSVDALTNEALLALSPMLEEVAGWVTSLVVAFQNLTPAQQQTIAVIAGLVAAAGPLVEIVGNAKTMVESLGKAFKWLTKVPVGPTQLAFLAITALVLVGKALYENWDEIKEWAGEVWEKIKTTVDNAIRPIREWIDGMIARVKKAIDWVKDLLGLNRRAKRSTPPSPPPADPGGGYHEFGRGGIVPGPVGRKLLAIVHGGETIIPTHRPGVNVIYGEPAATRPAAVGGRGAELLAMTGNQRSAAAGRAGDQHVVFERGAFEGAVIMDDYSVDRLMDRVVQRARLLGVRA